MQNLTMGSSEKPIMNSKKGAVVNSKLEAYLRWQRDIQRSKSILREFSQAIKEFELEKSEILFNDDITIYCADKAYTPSELMKAARIEKNHLELLIIVAQTARSALLCEVSEQGKGFYEYQTLKTLYNNTIKQLGLTNDDNFFEISEEITIRN